MVRSWHKTVTHTHTIYLHSYDEGMIQCLFLLLPLAVGNFLDIDRLLSVLVQIPKQETVRVVLLFHMSQSKSQQLPISTFTSHSVSVRFSVVILLSFRFKLLKLRLLMSFS